MTYVPSPPPAPLQKTSADVQSESEAERAKLNYSQRGLAATILTGGLGDVSAIPTRGVNLGGR